MSIRFDKDKQEVITIRDNVKLSFLLVFRYNACFYNNIFNLMINAMTQLIKEEHHFILAYTVQGNSLPAKDSLLDLWKHHIALTTVLCSQDPSNFEVESHYQLKSSKQADMLITTPGFFLISYYKIKHQLKLVQVTKREWEPQKINVSKLKPSPDFFISRG